MAEHPRREQTPGDLGPVGLLAADPGQPRLEQALADAPALKAVELDRQPVGDLIVVSAQRDADR